MDADNITVIYNSTSFSEATNSILLKLFGSIQQTKSIHECKRYNKINRVIEKIEDNAN